MNDDLFFFSRQELKDGFRYKCRVRFSLFIFSLFFIYRLQPMPENRSVPHWRLYQSNQEDIFQLCSSWMGFCSAKWCIQGSRYPHRFPSKGRISAFLSIWYPGEYPHIFDPFMSGLAYHLTVSVLRKWSALWWLDRCVWGLVAGWLYPTHPLDLRRFSPFRSDESAWCGGSSDRGMIVGFQELSIH